jgi:putative heme-binding domain-containing protein
MGIEIFSAVFGILAVWCAQSKLYPSMQAQQRGNKAASYEPGLVEAGSKLFVGSCSVCHGIDGRGGARGPDLTQGLVVNRGSDDEVSRVIRQGVPGSSMAAFDLPDSQIQQLVAFIRSLSTKASQVSVPGNYDAGNQIFYGRAHCSECHMIRGQGGLLGPELSNIGNERTLSEIRQSILKPGSSPQRQFRRVTIELERGGQVTGVLRNRDDFSLQMIDEQGRLRFLLFSEMRQVTVHERSFMPDNYESLLRPDELQDLLAYLSRQTVAAASQKEEGTMKKGPDVNLQ